MSSYFFRVEHDLLRSELFQSLGGSAIKVYLVIGLYADFETGWAYPSIRTIARQAGLSRQTVLDAIADLCRTGLLATSKVQGKSTAYRIIRTSPERPPHITRREPAATAKSARPASATASTGPDPFGGASAGVPFSWGEAPETGPDPLGVGQEPGPTSFGALAQFLGLDGPVDRPNQEPETRQDTASIAIPGTPFRLTAEGAILVVGNVARLLKEQGISGRSAERLAERKNPEDVAKVLLNAAYLKSQGKLQNEAGYITTALERGYDLLPAVAGRLESRRRELVSQVRQAQEKQRLEQEQKTQEAEQAAIALVLESLGPERLEALVQRALKELPAPISKRNPTLSNPFVRAKVYELACHSPTSA